jgi:hypothetical protein
MERKVLKYLLIVSSPILILMVSVCAISPSDEFHFSYIKNDCSSQSLGIYKRLYLDTERIDMAFFGSSHTLMGVNDSLINALNKNIQAVNLGYCRFGRDLHYTLFKKALERKKIRIALFEITETEPSYSHPDFAFLSESSDVFLPSFIYNQDWLKNRFNTFLFHIAYLRLWFFGNNNLKPYYKACGHVPHPGVADSAYLENQKKEKLKDLRVYNAETITRKAELSFSAYYLNKIKELGAKNNCKVYFIYLPAYGNDAKNSLDSTFYKPYFKSLIPPDSILNNYRSWQDEAHFNNQGATKLTTWLLQQVKNN